MEGPLSKWINVVKGWQCRWCVLNMEAGLLIYYTSKEKMEQDRRRACLELFDAQVGIDNEFDTIFTITVQNKIFHFQACNVDERNQWLDALQTCRNMHAPASWTPSLISPPNVDPSEFDRKIMEADVYLRMLIDQKQKLDERLQKCDSQQKEACEAIRIRIDNITESMKQGIVCLQHAKQVTLNPHEHISFPIGHKQHTSMAAASTRHSTASHTTPGRSSTHSQHHPKGRRSAQKKSPAELSRSSLNVFQRNTLQSLTSLSNGSRSFSTLALTSNQTSATREGGGSLKIKSDRHSDPDENNPALHDPATAAYTTNGPLLFNGTDAEGGVAGGEGDADSFSSSSDEDDKFFDTAEDFSSSPEFYQTLENQTSNAKMPQTALVRLTVPLDNAEQQRADNNDNHHHHQEDDDPFPLDELYDQLDEEDLGNVQQHGSVIFYLLGQLRIGMDLTKISLPTFILEKRSTLEMYADFLAHADLWLSIGDGATPQDRLVACVRWYLSAFHAGRRSAVAKKPYNPILGEVFQCFWDVPGSSASDVGGGSGGAGMEVKAAATAVAENNSDKAPAGPLPWAPDSAVVFVSEQVSHHPPISAFYAEHKAKQMAVNGYIWTKSKFLGLSLCVEMVGQTVISVLRHNEEYTFTFPCGYGRNILNVPWIELGGKVVIQCPKTGYYANVDFRTKPFYGGKKDQIRADCFAPNERKPFLCIEGEWNGQMHCKYPDGRSQLFVDTKAIPILQKRLKPRNEQMETESRRLWQDVTRALKEHNIEAATTAKQLLEQRQRDDAKERQEKGVKWQTKLFHEEGQHWIYNAPLMQRLEPAAHTTSS